MVDDRDNLYLGPSAISRSNTERWNEKAGSSNGLT